MTKLVIEKNIPIPARSGGAGPEANSLAGKLRAMDVGDSIFLAGKKQTNVVTQSGAIGRPLGRKFATRVVEGGVRIWRTE